MRAVSLAGLAVTLAAALGGCHGDGACGLRLCDIADPDCQQRTLQATACLRQVAPVDVPVSVVDRASFRAMAGAQPIDPAQAERWRVVNLGLSLLGLADENAQLPDVLAGNTDYVGAWYSSIERAIKVVISPGQRLDDQYTVATLVHEYTHALQQAAGRFDGPPDPDTSYDRSLAAAALIEGEADLISDIATLELFGRDEGDVAWPALYDRARARALRFARSDSLPVEHGRAYFAYPFGTAYVHVARALGGYPALDALGAAPPRSTRQVMAGPAATEPRDEPWLEDLGADAEPLLPDGFQRVASDRLGAFMLRVFLASWGSGFDSRGQPFDPAADELRGDHLSIFHLTDPASPSSPLVVTSWRLRFGSEVTAARLARNLTRPDSLVQQWWHEARDRDVIILAVRGLTTEVDPTKLTWRASAPEPTPPPGMPDRPGTRNPGLPVLPSAPSCSIRSAGSFLTH